MYQVPTPLHPTLKSSKSVSLTAYSSTLVMDAARIPETSPHFYQSAWCGNPVHIRLYVYRCEKMRPQLVGGAVTEKCCRRRRFSFNLLVYMCIMWGQRRPVCRAENLATFMCRLSFISGSLNFLEPSGTVKACNGITLSFYVFIKLYSLIQIAI
jgi:hypothetical protein